MSRLAEINLPAICIYSRNDNFVERPVLEDTIQRLGMNLNDTLHYDKEGIKMEKSKGRPIFFFLSNQELIKS